MSGVLRPSATPEAAELLVALLARDDVALGSIGSISEATWFAITREANWQGVLPLLRERMRELPEGSVPAAVTAGVLERYTTLALQSALLMRELEQIAAALAPHAIPVLLLKGMHLAADVYDHPALRSMSDIDIMVPRDRLEESAQALEDAGFGVPPLSDLDDWCRAHSHWPRMTPPANRGVGVEVHWTIELPTSPFDIRPAELWASARTISIKGRDVWVLSPEHLLLHLCLHACYHHKFGHTPLKQLCDIAAVLRRYEKELEWDVVVGAAERWGIQPFVRFTLLLARELLHCEVPPTILSLPADAEEAKLLENARAYILNCTMAMPTAFKKAVRARTWKRSLHSVTHIFPPRARMAAIYGLPRTSPRIWLWYALRPFDLLLRKGRMTMELLLPGRTGRRMRYTERNRLELKISLRKWADDARRPTGTA